MKPVSHGHSQMEVTRVRGQWQVENQIYMGQWFSNVELPPGREGRHTWPGGTSITYDIYIYVCVYDKGIREY